MLSPRAVAGMGALAALAAPLLAVAVAWAASSVTHPDPPDDVVYVDEQNNVVGAGPAGHAADITSITVSLNSTVQACVLRPNVPAGGAFHTGDPPGGVAAAQTIPLYSLFVAILFYFEEASTSASQLQGVAAAQWQWHEGQLSWSVIDINSQPIAGASISTNDGGRTVCAVLPASYAPQFNRVFVLSFAKPTADEPYRARDMTPLLEASLQPDPPTPTPTATPTEAPATATPTEAPATATPTSPPPTATSTQPPPTATATQQPPTATNSPTPPSAATATAPPGAAISTATSSPAPSATASATASPTPTPTTTPTTAPTATPSPTPNEPVVVGGVAPTGPPGSERFEPRLGRANPRGEVLDHVAQLPADIVMLQEVSLRWKVLGTNILLAILLAVLFGLSQNSFDNVMENRESTLGGWMRRLRTYLNRLRRLDAWSTGRQRLIAYALLPLVFGLYGLLYTILEPGDLWSRHVLFVFIALAISIGIVELADDLGKWVFARRNEARTRLSLLPTNLVAAGFAAVTTRAFAIVPGFIVGVPGALEVEEGEPSERGRLNLAIAGWLGVLGLGLGTWLLSAAMPVLFDNGDAIGRFSAAHAQDFLLIVYFACIEILLFEMLPVLNSGGQALLKRSKVAWGIAFIAILFAAFMTLFNPNSGWADDFKGVSVVGVLAVIAVLDVMLILIWRFSTPRAAAPATG